MELPHIRGAQPVASRMRASTTRASSRRAASGMAARDDSAACPVGWVLLATDDRGAFPALVLLRSAMAPPRMLDHHHPAMAAGAGEGARGRAALRAAAGRGCTR